MVTKDFDKNNVRKIRRITSTRSDTGHFSFMQLSEMASLPNYRWQNRKERPNRSTNNEDTAETAKRYIIYEEVRGSVSDTLVREKLSF